MAKKETIRRLHKTCAICGRKIRLALYKDRTYRGGHYFGRVPLCTEREIAKALRAGTRKTTIAGHTLEVLKKSPKFHILAEYWECPGCYWGR